MNGLFGSSIFATKADEIWMDQIARNLCNYGGGFLTGNRYLIHDRDPLFRTAFHATLADCTVMFCTNDDGMVYHAVTGQDEAALCETAL